MKESFDEVDADFLARPGNSPDGCSAVIALLTGSRLFIANVGNAVAFVGEETDSGDLRVTRATVVHTLATARETMRVTAVGAELCHDASGCQQVLCSPQQDDGKVETLHVSRALGNRSFKAAVKDKDKDKDPGEAEAVTPPTPLIATPDVSVTVLGPQHRALVLGCAELGGLPDTFVAEVLSKRHGRPRMACGALLQEAQRREVKGSLATICVFLDWSPPPPVGPVQVAEPPAKKMRAEAGAQAKGSQVRCRTILVKHKGSKEPVDTVRGNKPVTRTLAEAERILVECLEEIENKKGPIFTQRCKAVSECNTCLKGGEMAGDLGWMSRGQYNHVVESAAFALPIGHISDIVESDEGVHVLWRIA